MILNDRRLCDTCIFMADSCHFDMCLHPLRRDKGRLGEILDTAIVWNGNCPVYIEGEPCFYELLDSADSFEYRMKNAERVRLELAMYFWEGGKVTAKDLTEALTQKSLENVGEVKKHRSLFGLEEELNFRAYKRLEEELLTKYRGQYVAIAKGELLVVADNFDQATTELKAMAPEARHFLVFQAGEEPEREVIQG